MIITEKKPYEEILGQLDNEEKLIIIGCGLCATTTQTGGETEVAELKEKLTKEKKIILKTEVIEAVCDERKVRIFLNKNKNTIEKADAIIVLACGAGVQSISNLNDTIKLHSGLNTLFLGTEKRMGQFNQFCSLCGDCVLDMTNGICPVTRCPKSYINGPCGGAKNNKCEANPENDCVWCLIAKRELSQKIKKDIRDNRKHNKQIHPQNIVKKIIPHKISH